MAKRKRKHDSQSNKNTVFTSAPSPIPKDTFRKIAIAIIIITGLIVYFNTFANKFIWDDDLLIIRNEYIRSWKHIVDIFLTDVHRFGNIRSNFYRPTQTLTYMIDHTFWKLNPMGYHITNALIHIVNAVLIYIVFFYILNSFIRNRVATLNAAKASSIALFTSLLWLVHPVHTQCTSYISGRADLLAVTFIMLSVYAYINNKKTYIPIIFFFLALISKETSMITPLLFIAYDIAAGNYRGTFGEKRKVLFKYLPYALIVLVFVILRCTVIRFPGAPFMEAKVDLYSRILTSARAIVVLLGVLVLPLNLSMSRNIPWEVTFFNTKVFFSLAALIAVFLYAFWIRKKERPVFFGILWFFIAFIPTANIFPVNANVSEHWMYLPSIGYFFIVSIILLDKFLFHNYRKNIILISALVVFYGYLTIMRNFDWKDEITFYHQTLKTMPNSDRVHYNLGNAYGLKNINDKALQEYLIAIKLKPDYAEAYSNMGLIYFRMGQIDKAIESYRTAHSFRQDLIENYANLAMAYEKKGLYADARKEFEAAIKLKPNHIVSMNGLGVIYAREGDYLKAKEFFNRVLEIEPGNPQAEDNLKRLSLITKQQK